MLKLRMPENKGCFVLFLFELFVASALERELGEKVYTN